MVKVVLIGYGHLGRWHAEKIAGLDNAELVAIVERDTNQQELAKEKFPETIVVSSIEEVKEFDGERTSAGLKSFLGLA